MCSDKNRKWVLQWLNIVVMIGCCCLIYYAQHESGKECNFKISAWLIAIGSLGMSIIAMDVLLWLIEWLRSSCAPCFLLMACHFFTAMSLAFLILTGTFLLWGMEDSRCCQTWSYKTALTLLVFEYFFAISWCIVCHCVSPSALSSQS